MWQLKESSRGPAELNTLKTVFVLTMCEVSDTSDTNHSSSGTSIHCTSFDGGTNDFTVKKCVVLCLASVKSLKSVISNCIYNLW